MRHNDNRRTNAQADMPLTGHLRELRNRIVICAVTLAAGIMVCLSFSGRLINLLTAMGKPYGYNFVYLAPQELLLVYFQMAFLGGIVIAVPVIAYEVYAFCSPALEKEGKRAFLSAMIFGAFCFCIGVAFAYFIVLPFMLGFLVKFSVGMDITNNISIGEYINFLTTIFIIFGIIFEMPIICVTLSGLGILKPQWLANARRYAIVAIFVVAAIITPPDVVSQIMVAVPMLGLYELSIWLSRLSAAARRTRKQEKEAAEE